MVPYLQITVHVLCWVRLADFVLKDHSAQLEATSLNHVHRVIIVKLII